MAFATTPLIGIQLTQVDSSPGFGLGTTVMISDGGTATYVKASADISTYAAVGVTVSNTAAMLTTTTAATTKKVGVAQTSIASGLYGWVQIGGAPIVNMAANVAPSVPLYTTATAGVLDDATVSGGLVAGIVASVSISNATAVTCIAASGMMILTGATPA